MTLDWLQQACLALPSATEDVKWGNDLCFLIGGKMFCVASLVPPLSVSFKVKDEEFDSLSQRDGIIPAPYMARHKWVMVKEAGRLSKKEWKHYVEQSYQLVKDKLPAKQRKELGL